MSSPFTAKLRRLCECSCKIRRFRGPIGVFAFLLWKILLTQHFLCSGFPITVKFVHTTHRTLFIRSNMELEEVSSAKCFGGFQKVFKHHRSVLHVDVQFEIFFPRMSIILILQGRSLLLKHLSMEMLWLARQGEPSLYPSCSLAKMGHSVGWETIKQIITRVLTTWSLNLLSESE